MTEDEAVVVDGDVGRPEPCDGLADVLDGLADVSDHDVAWLGEA